MITTEKLTQSQERLSKAIEKIFEQDNNFTGQITLDIHCKDGIIKDIYEIRQRRKV